MGKLKDFRDRYFTEQEVTSSRVNNFNAIRLVAALMVMYGHMASIMGIGAYPVLNQRVSTIGVKIFFIISGYLITKSYLNDSHPARYLVRRVFRVIPGLLVLSLLTILLLGPAFTTLPVGEYFRHPVTWAYLKNALLCPVYGLPGVFAECTYPNAVNGSLWSLPVEFALYLLLPLLVLLFKKLGCLRRGILVSAIVFLVLDLIRIRYAPDLRLVAWGSNWADALTLIPMFLIGSYLSFPECRRHLNFQFATALLLCASLLSFSYVASELVVALVLPYFILSFALVERPIFGNWFAVNDFSYGIYLYGFAIQQILWLLLGKYNPGVNVMTLLSFAVAFLFGAFSWFAVEKPAQKLAKKLLALMTPKQEA